MKKLKHLNGNHKQEEKKNPCPDHEVARAPFEWKHANNNVFGLGSRQSTVETILLQEWHERTSHRKFDICNLTHCLLTEVSSEREK